MIDQKYYNELSKLSLLTQEETQVLFENVRLGDERANNKIIESNLRLVIYYANNYTRLLKGNDTLEIGDLISEGNIGLIQAINKYDPTKETKFSYFASIWIKKQIIECLLNNLTAIRSPCTKLKSDSKIRKMIAKLEQERFESIGEQEIRNLNIYSEDELNHFYNKSEVVPMPEYIEMIGDEQQEEDEPDNLKLIKSALKILKPRERKILKEYFGIGTDKKSLSKIGEELNITKQRVLQIKMSAIQKIRINWGTKKLGLQP